MTGSVVSVHQVRCPGFESLVVGFSISVACCSETMIHRWLLIFQLRVWECGGGTTFLLLECIANSLYKYIKNSNVGI